MLTQDQILEKLRHLACDSLRLHLSDGELSAMVRLDEYAGVDSLAVLTFVATVERGFGVRLASQALNRETIADLPRLAGHLKQLLGNGC